MYQEKQAEHTKKAEFLSYFTWHDLESKVHKYKTMCLLMKRKHTYGEEGSRQGLGVGAGIEESTKSEGSMHTKG